MADVQSENLTSFDKKYAAWLVSFKKMCRLLEIARHEFIDKEWAENYSSLMPQQQFIHLMMVRPVLPCNLSKIMVVTGLTSAGASIFVNKMVKLGVFIRSEDQNDRRNVVISFSPMAIDQIKKIEKRLDGFICSFFPPRTESELDVLLAASKVVSRSLDPDNAGR